MPTTTRTLTCALVCLVLSISFTGCGGGAGGAADDIIGVWQVDMAAMKAKMEAEMGASDDPGAKMGMQMLEGMLGNATFEFTDDKMIVTMMGETQESAYEVTSSTADSVTVNGKDQQGNDVEVTMTITGPSTMTISNSADPDNPMLLKRQ